MTDEVDPPKPRVRYQGKPNNWFPKDHYGDELAVNDFVMFTNYTGYPRPAFGSVFRIGKTGKVHVRTIKLHSKEDILEIEVKEASSITKLSNNIKNALMLDKLARP